MIIKCKMCGGDIQFNPGDTSGQCDHCGCTTTFPKLPDEQRTNLFNRANHFRRQCEFDKAMAAYEHILEEDDTDAEAHWGIVLSKFGIEYVEDPVTHERIPTCHRAQVISILSDEDYQNALKYAPDTYSREIYEKEAKRIAEIQKGILAISSQEKPYDVFICYKETDDSGSRTKDSTLAQEIYYQLTNEGYKVFFSRITLEDKLGQEYEPYIFAALNSAKVMLVVGTKPEYFNAVWVKNEWSRYLALMKNDRKRVLIPCYRDMDPYDLPEELSSLQSQDMGKIGFMQDIIHGVKKVLGSDKQNTPNVTVQAAGPGVASLHKRAVLFLEDKDWDSATEYFDRILDIDPEYAPAYIGKVQVKNQVRREADLARCREPISADPDFQKAVRFADENQKAIYNGYNRAILDRIELERKEAAYREAAALENRAAVEADFLAAAKKYDSAGNIRDAKDRAANCRAKASSAKAEAEKAAAVYKEQMERERRERARQEEERRLAEEKRRAEEAERQRKEEELRKENRKRALKIFSVIAAVALIITGGYLVYDKVIHPKMKYDQAQALLNEGKLDEAYAAFSEMLDYGDSATKLLEVHYKRAEGFLNAGQLAEAKQYYGLASGYSDSAQQIKNIEAYAAAEADYRNNDLVSAGEKYHALGDFLDSSSKFEAVSGTLYAQAKAALDGRDYGQAFSLLTTLGDYADCPTLIANVDSEYEAALTSWNNGKKFEAEQSLQPLTGWRDAGEKLAALRLEIADEAAKNEDYDTALAYYGKVPRNEEIEGKITFATQGKAYQEAVKALEAGNLETAYTKFIAAGEHKDAVQQAGQLQKYQQANDLLETGGYEEARTIYNGLGDYLSSSANLTACNAALYQEATELYSSGNLTEAYRLYTLISGYSDSKEIADGMDSAYQAVLDHIEKGERLEAEAILVKLAGWRDAGEKLAALRLEIADEATKNEDYDTALAYYGKLPRNEEIEGKIASATQGKAYQEAVKALEAGNLETAYTKFIAAGEHKDAVQQADQLQKYQQANGLLEAGGYEEARTIYNGLGDYLSSSANLTACNAALYQEATELYSSGNLTEAYRLYTLISGYSDSKEIADGMDSAYQAVLDHIEKGERLEAEAILVKLAGWKDVDEKIETLRHEIADNAVGTGDYDTAISYYGMLSNKTEEVEAMLTVSRQGKSYHEAADALKAGDLETAYTKYIAAGDFEDAAEQAGTIDAYQQANGLLSEGKYQEARKVYIELGTFLDSATKLNICNDAIYQEAAGLKKQDDFAKAYELFVLISGYSDSADVAKKIRDDYKAAEGLLEDGKYDEANAAFLELHNYSDSPTKAQECLYQKAESLKTAGSYDDAIAIYSGLAEYKDSADKINACQYSKAESLLAGKDIDGAILLFESIPEYSDSSERAQALRYEKAQTLWDNGDLQAARAEYETLGEYSDAPDLLTKVLTEIADNSMANKDYVSALSAYQGLEQTPEIQEREYKLAQICYDEGYFEEATSAYETLGKYELSLSKLPIARYAWADQLFKAGEYAKAAEQFALLGDMTDSATRAQESIYQLAKMHLEKKDYDVAKSHYASIPGYSDADTMCKECDYRKATDLLNEGKNKEAETIFKALGEYSDSKTKAEECAYNQAEALFSAGKYAEAKKLYDTITFSDSSTKSKQCVYNQAEALFTAKKYADAKVMYASIDYLDSKDKAKESTYQEADVLYQGKKYAEAESVFSSITGYNDSDDRAKECHLQQGRVLMEAGDYQKALVFFESVDYADSAAMAAKCHYELGRALHLAGNTDAAIAEYAYAVSLPEARSALLSASKDYSVINEPEKAIQTLWLIRDHAEAQDELNKIATIASQNEHFDIALVTYSVYEEHPEVYFIEDYQKTSYDSIKTLINSCSLLPRDLKFQEYALYSFASMARDYGHYDLSVQAYSDLGEYCDSTTQVLATRYAQGEAKRAIADWEGAVKAFTEAENFSDAVDQISETRYQEASAKEKAGDQQGAYDIFISLGEYKDSFERANKPYYELGISKKEAGEWDAAVSAFEHAGTYSDALEQINDSHYQHALYLLALPEKTNKDYEKAYNAFMRIQNYANYKDVKSILNNSPELLKIKWNEQFAIGSIVNLGTFEQDNNTKNGEEPIEWIVIDASNGRALLLSKYVLLGREFNDNAYRGEGGREHNSVTWKTSALYSWLNKEFIKSFSKTEQTILKPTENGTVFILDATELNKYIPNEANRICQPTEYALQRGASVSHGGAWWWLRDIYFRTFYRNGNTISYRNRCYEAGIVYGSGEISDTGNIVSIDEYGVRPAIWIDYSAGPIVDWLQNEKKQ